MEIRLEEKFDWQILEKGFRFAALLAAIFSAAGLVLLGVPQPEKRKQLAIGENEILPAFEPEAFYVSAITQGTVFQSPAQALESPALSLQESAKDYRLKGVFLGGEPEAILEDARSNQTFFVKKGDRAGVLVVKDIQEGSVALAFPGYEKSTGSGEIRLEIKV